MNNIRNFCIVAHIDHGKSTLADRFLELTGTIEKRKMKEQFLDTMELERERGITIKLQPVRMSYRFEGRDYMLNLIDTPGHVDFSYEVSRSLAAVEGAILLVDATKGVQAQTLANLYLAQQQGLTIVPAINKIDLPGARVEMVEDEIKELLGQNAQIYKISGKEGVGVEELLQTVIKKVAPPKIDADRPFRALVFDSNYDAYKGVLAYVRIVDGRIKRGDKIMFMASGAKVEAIEVGIFTPALKAAEELRAGEIGYIATGLKEVALCRVGDTMTVTGSFDVEQLPGYKEPKPMVFASFYPAVLEKQEAQDYNQLRDALSKLKLSDAALVFEPESSDALGRGFKCGFLGMLHLEIVSERLRREYNLDLIVTTPSVVYRVKKKNREELVIYSPQKLPDPSVIDEIREPWVKLEVIGPSEYLGVIMKLLQSTGGAYLDTQYLGAQRVVISYEAPLREIIVDFYDKLKSATSGYASMGYELLGWRKDDLVRLDILVAQDPIEAFARIIPRHKAAGEGRAIVEKLKEILPPQMFAVALQAAVGGKIVAREDLAARRKDVTAKLYGGDVTRKNKLLDKQKKGKKKMRDRGSVNIPQEVFLKVLKK
ncbi:MAG: translation elongation factor 4 [Candidatus Portnoybacteria bacterium]|nr:translation elongation factor 4 [Candidatus Portnoybacteria bacterium]MDD4982542.1 translation elongation factor 4 [Candidatus Portnoybacteria bacterium]